MLHSAHESTRDDLGSARDEHGVKNECVQHEHRSRRTRGDHTFAYLRSRPLAPRGKEWDRAVEYWRTLRSDQEARFDVEVNIHAEDIGPTFTGGTSPQDIVSIHGSTPDPEKCADIDKRRHIERALEYMGLAPNTPMKDITVDKVFIGSRHVWDEEAEELLLRALEDQQSIAESHWWRSQVHIEPFKGPVVLRGEAAHLYLTAEVCTLVAWLQPGGSLNHASL